jgi:sec-independent protein translocase protein TatA
MLGSLSIVHWLVIIGVVAILFGKDKISSTMGDIVKGIGRLRKGLSDDDIDSLPPT